MKKEEPGINACSLAMKVQRTVVVTLSLALR